MRGLHHVGITVKDLDASIRFYHDVLGLPFSNEPSPWFEGEGLGKAVGVPGASLRQTLATVEDYDHHSRYFSPEVVRSKTLEHTGEDYKVYLRLTRKKIVTVVYDTEYEVHYELLTNARAQSQSYSTRIAEVAHPGEADERQRSRGVGRALVQHLQDLALAAGCEATTLDSGTQRTQAHKFYFREGMVVSSFHFRKPLK